MHWALLTTIIVGTLISEDLTCITAGLLIHQGQLGWITGIVGCFAGIYVGDLGLWLLGRVVGQGLVHWPWLMRRLQGERLERLGQWFDERGWLAILASRFLPGTRLPLYVAAGILGRKGGRFALWTLLAALIWTPLVVGTVALLGEKAILPFTYLLGAGWLSFLLAIVLIVVALRTVMMAFTSMGRARLVARVSRLWRYEFWPSWIFYFPVLPWFAYLSLRYRGLTIWTAANPGIPDGGVVGESKYAILSQLPAEWVVPTILVPSAAEKGSGTFCRNGPEGASHKRCLTPFPPPSEEGQRIRHLQQSLASKQWGFPLILKPDQGQRGEGVKLARDMADVEKYAQKYAGAFLVQPYHPGPFEAGIFYYRIPGEPAGHIFSITDKHFSFLVGDGRSTIEELIWRHPRYRMQAGTFLNRHAQSREHVLAQGETFALALAGDHCQGTMFCDGSHLMTRALERSVDAIAREFRGFFIGRFDVRYRNVEAFKAGCDLAIVELNGVTSESTNIYDPSWSLVRAYRTLCRQWALLYRIGDINRRREHRPATPLELFRLVLQYRQAQVDPLAD